jgi:hypothetical protein
MTGNLIADDVAWYKAYLDTPLVMPRCPSVDAATRTPGCSLKSRERATTGSFKGFPTYFGKLVSFDVTRDEVKVRSVAEDGFSPKFVWTGTLREYHATWECD